MNNNRNFNDDEKKKKSKDIAHRKMRKNDDAAASPDFTRQLLSSLGNQAFSQVASGGLVQAKLQSTAASSPFEKQADQVAEQMVGKNPAENKTPSINKIQPQGNTGSKLSGETEAGLTNIKGKGNGLSRDLRNYFEPRFGKDLGNVRIHTGTNADKLATDLNARAFTHGNNIVFKDGQYQPGTTEGKKLIAHELTHTVQQGGGVNPTAGRTVQAKGLEGVPEKKRTSVKVVTEDMLVPKSKLLTYFDPAFSVTTLPRPEVIPWVKWNLNFSGVPAELQEGLRQIAGLYWGFEILGGNASVTLTIRFADQNFAAQPYFKNLPKNIQDIFLSYGIFRFTRIQKSDGKGGKTEQMFVKFLGAINKKKQKPTAEETVNYKAVFDEYFSILSGSAAGKGYKNYTNGEKEMLYKAVAELPESVLKRIAGVKWIRRDKDPNPNNDLFGEYSIADHTICLFDKTFQDQNVLYGSILKGFHSEAELTIFHEIAHALDWAEIREVSAKEKEAFDDFSKAAEIEQRLSDEQNELIKRRVQADKEYRKYNDEYERLHFERALKVDEYNSYKDKTLTAEGKITIERLKEEIAELDYKLKELKKKRDEAKEMLDAINARLPDVKKLLKIQGDVVDEKEAEMIKATEERANVVSPSGITQDLKGGKWVNVPGSEKTRFCAAAIKDGAKQGKGKTIDGAITDYGETDWEEYYCESFSLYFGDAQRLRLLRPNVFKYFFDNYGS